MAQRPPGDGAGGSLTPLTTLLTERMINPADTGDQVPISLQRLLDWEKRAVAWISRSEDTGLSREDIATKTWETWEETNDNRSFGEALRGWRPGKPGVMLLGKKGLGKTHALKALINQHATSSYRAKFLEMAQFCKDLRSMDREGDGQYYARLFSHRRILVLDDIGEEKTTDFIASEIIAFLKRVMKEHQITLFMTSNLTADEFIARYHERTLDRLRELMVIIPVTKGRSYRDKIHADNVRRLREP
jgi:predicted ATPase